MIRTPARVLFLAGMAGAIAPAGSAQQSVVDSPHNLSATGPGSVRAVTESEVCIFCHAPHNASPIQPLWNRTMPIEAYSIYTSRALDALPGQPTGTSKMCLSCHDGTIALGAVVSRSMPILMSGGATTIPAGPGHIGTDLRDDHPISFRFDSALASRDPKLRNPAGLPEQIRLDANSELQCTSCHDAHNNARGAFLVMENTTSGLCTSCHDMGQTTITGHTNCNACHQPHTAPSGPYLLRGANATETCNRCHDGAIPGAPDIAADLRKAYIHDTASPVDPPLPLLEHATCTSCHDPHTMSTGSGIAPSIHPSLGRISGVSSAGAPIAVATTEHEVCFKCHADDSPIDPAISRLIVQNNTRLEFGPNAVSFHPVGTTGRNMDVPSLLPPWNEASTMYCSDCHASDTGAKAGGGGPDGVHGSNEQWLLSARYNTLDNTSESATAYALCYRCHDRSSILGDRSFPLHKTHIVDARTPCAACHDGHGISNFQGSAANNSNLINFATAVAQPGSNGKLEFLDLGTYRGECSTTCHGRDHAPARYGF